MNCYDIPMRNWLHNRFSNINGFLSKLPGFSNPEKHSVSFLNSTQFLGALNDNIYKLVLIFYLIQLEGPQHANAILSVAGAIFVIPFLLFSSAAGILADRFSKSRMIILVKANEILVILLALAAFVFKVSWGSYAILFLLATQSALFGPPKYGIIPELVTKNHVSKANGLIVSFTYLAIILGTFLASFLTEITHNNYIVVGLFCLLVAIGGFFSSFGIKYTPAKGTKKTLNIFFIREIWRTLVACKKKKHLQIAISGSSYFLFIGGFTQLNIIPFAMTSMGLTEIAGGYLFLTTALGIATGAVFAGRASKRQIELGLSCVSGIVIGLLFFLLAHSDSSIPMAVFSLFLIGFAGGTFIVPFDAFIQLESPEENRGHVIAAANFLSFVGVLIASFAIYLFNEKIGLTAAQSFIVMGWITLFFSLFLLIRLTDLFLSWSARKFLYKLFPVKPVDISLVSKSPHPLLMLEEATPLKAWLLCGYFPNLHILVPQYKTRSFPYFERFFYSLHRIASPQKFEKLIAHGQQFMDPDTIPCIYLRKKKPIPEKELMPTPFKKKTYEIISVNITKGPKGKVRLIRFSK